MKDGVTVTAASQLLSGYKARTSDGTLVTGSDAGYSAGVTQGHADRDSGVTVTDPYHILSGYKGRKSNGDLVTGTNGGWDAGRSQGQADMKSGVTVTNASQIVNGYKARNSSGTLLTGTYTDVTHTVKVTAKSEVMSDHWNKIHIVVTKDGNALYDGSLNWRTNDGTEHKVYDVGTWNI